MKLENVNALVVGMAKSGIAAVELLVKKGARVRATDVKPLFLPRLDELRVPFAIQTPKVFENADLIVISPGVPADLPELGAARNRGAEIIGELELASFFLEGKSIGITGSNGKTTTTALVGHILRQSGVPCQVGGNIGTPPSAMVDSSRAYQWNVLELSSFQLETIQNFRAEIGLALNVTPDHLDRHHTLGAYIAAKRRLFETQKPDDFAVLNADDPVCAGYAAATRAHPVWFSSTRPVPRGVWLAEEQILCDGMPLLRRDEIPLRGLHNVENVMAASAAALLAHAPLESIASAVKTFPGVEHRLEFVRALGGVAYYNDSKATNVDATLKAIAAFPGRLWIILGGKDKDSDYAPLGPPLKEKAVAALLIGAAAEKIASALGGSARVVRAGTLPEALRAAHAGARPGDTVLLAPACASFDQFENYEHRGRVFKQLVLALEAPAA